MCSFAWCSRAKKHRAKYDASMFRDAALMKAMAKDPEIMNMLGDPKMQEIMKTMMSGGPDAMKKYMSDPDAVALLGKVNWLSSSNHVI